jgi:hypothetical protein
LKAYKNKYTFSKCKLMVFKFVAAFIKVQCYFCSMNLPTNYKNSLRVVLILFYYLQKDIPLMRCPFNVMNVSVSCHRAQFWDENEIKKTIFLQIYKYKKLPVTPSVMNNYLKCICFRINCFNLTVMFYINVAYEILFNNRHITFHYGFIVWLFCDIGL